MTDAPSTTPVAAPGLTAVSIGNVDVPFGRLVLFFVKTGLAAIPAIIIVMLTVGLVGALLRGLFRLGWWGMHGGYGYW